MVELGYLNYFLDPTSPGAWSRDDGVACAADPAWRTEADLYATMNDLDYSWLNRTTFSVSELECLRLVAEAELWDPPRSIHIAPSSSRAWV